MRKKLRRAARLLRRVRISVLRPAAARQTLVGCCAAGCAERVVAHGEHIACPVHRALINAATIKRIKSARASQSSAAYYAAVGSATHEIAVAEAEAAMASRSVAAVALRAEERGLADPDGGVYWHINDIVLTPEQARALGLDRLEEGLGHA